jgi:uncharacterized protein YbjT (DUF2867 family)
MILVTGATGNVGAELVVTLHDRGEAVRGLSRGDRPPRLPPGVEAVTGDLDRPDSLGEALHGVRAVFLLPGYEDMAGLLSAIGEAGAQRVVLLSGGSAGSGDMTNAVTAYMIRSESAVRESGLPWTILRPTAFMSNALRWRPQLSTGDVVRGPFATVRTATIDPSDLAAVAAEALVGEGHAGIIYRPSGPEPLVPADQVRILGEALGRELHFEAQTNEEARAEMIQTMPPEYVDAFFDFYVTGTLDESNVTTAVQDVTRRPARTFEQWAKAHSDAFRE